MEGEQKEEESYSADRDLYIKNRLSRIRRLGVGL